MKCCQKIRKLFNKKSGMVFVAVAVSFFLLYYYRSNPSALKVGTQAPDVAFETMDGQKFKLNEYKMPVMLVFFNTNTFLSSGIYTELYLRNMLYLKGIDKANRAKLIIVTDGEQKKNTIREKLSNPRYKVLENYIYLSNIKQAEKDYGLSIWPHFFLIDTNKQILYEAKVPSPGIVDDILDRSH